MSAASTAKTYQVLSPFDGRVLKTLALTTPEEAGAVLDKAVALFEDKRKWLPVHERVKVLNKLKTIMAGKQTELAHEIAANGGKPLKDAVVEVVRAIDGIDVALTTLNSTELAGTQIPMGKTEASAGRLAWTLREPIGPVVAVSAFNHPLNLIVHQAIPAVAVGCPVVVKPSLATPLSCLSLEAMLLEAGLPKGWMTTVLAENDTSERLVTDDRLGFFSFIGSAKVGWSLRSKLAPGVRCALEHGGAAPVIVVDEDIQHLLPTLVKGAFYHAGQVCVSVQRVFVPHQKAEAFAKKLAAEADKLVVGDPSSDKTDVGPLINRHEADRIDHWVQEAVTQGAKLVTGGKRLGPTLYSPTVLLNPPAHAKVSSLEIFGPVACVYGYDSVDEAVALSNAVPYSFQASVFTKEWEKAFNIGRQLNASAVMVNESSTFRVDWMPFAGLKQSGFGIGGINYTMKDMTEEKMFVFRFSPKL